MGILSDYISIREQSAIYYYVEDKENFAEEYMIFLDEMMEKQKLEKYDEDMIIFERIELSEEALLNHLEKEANKCGYLI